jgi:ubiquinone/menaquinone biosynthesis C-methylase UbiE
LTNPPNSHDSADEIRRIKRVYADREASAAVRAQLDSGNAGNVQIVREQRNRLEQLLHRAPFPLDQARVLDVGCGSGLVLGWLHDVGVPEENLFGIDLLPNRIEAAQQRFPRFTFAVANAEDLSFPGGSFDLVVTFTVFSSILDRAVAENVARSIRRVLRIGGAVVWYDIRYPNPWNADVRAMTTPRIRRLFSDFAMNLEPITVIPPVARRLGPLTGSAYPVLAAVPLLRSHYLGFLQR